VCNICWIIYLFFGKIQKGYRRFIYCIPLNVNTVLAVCLCVLRTLVSCISLERGVFHILAFKVSSRLSDAFT
jgi:hypothetical protein